MHDLASSQQPTPAPHPTPHQGPPQRICVRDLLDPRSVPMRIAGAYSIANAQLGKTRSDKLYLRCLIGDCSGEVPGRMWTIDETRFRELPTDGFVWLDGTTQLFDGGIQLIIQIIRPIEPTPEQLRDLLPCSQRHPDDMFAELRAILNTLTNPAMKLLAEAFLSDELLMDQFKRCPAAKSMHHAYIGGLLEHTLSLLHLADRVCPLYPKISRDLVLMGLFLHDIGKTRELVYDRAFSYSDRGELVGHVVEGAMMLRDKATSLMREHGIRFPRGSIVLLEHIILSHHGVPEFGAVKIPASPEAILVSILDNLDAKMNMALAAARPDHPLPEGGNFTEKLWALDTKLYRPDPLA
jgi:3'-5' exoribonuclease